MFGASAQALPDIVGEGNSHGVFHLAHFPRTSPSGALSYTSFLSTTFHPSLHTIIPKPLSLSATIKSIHHGSNTLVRYHFPGRKPLTYRWLFSIAVYGEYAEKLQLYVEYETPPPILRSHGSISLNWIMLVNASELERLKKRFMKLDR